MIIYYLRNRSLNDFVHQVLYLFVNADVADVMLIFVIGRLTY